MKRRNFAFGVGTMLGVGTIATASGAVAVTSVSFAERVSAGSDFRVAAERDLTVTQGTGFDADEPYYHDSSLFAGGSLTVDFENLPVAHVTEGENGQLQVEVAITDEDQEDDLSFDRIIEIRNEGSATESVGIEYEFGADVGEDITAGDVVTLFEFETDEEGTPLSPADSNNDPRFVEIAADDGVQLNLNVNLTEDIADSTVGMVNRNPFDDETTVELLAGIVVVVEE